MSYANFLSNTIKNSGYSLRAIASLCEKKYNIKITASYLSRLQQKGNKNPASERVNIAIAKVCGINPDDLIFEADLERAPESVKNIVDLMVNYIKSMYISLIPNVNIKDSKAQEMFQSEMNKYINMGTREFITEMLNQDIDMEKPLEKDFSISEEDNEILNEMFMKFTVGIKMLDNSMFPIIKQGAKIELVKLDEYSNGDIVSVELNNTNLIRTYVKSGNNIVLIPANQDFETLTVPKKDIEIKGKVKSYTIDL